VRFAYPPAADLDRCGHAFAGGLAVQAKPLEQGAGDVRVIAGVEVDGDLRRPVRSDLVRGGCKGGREQRRVVAVGARGDDAQGHAGGFGCHRPLQAAFTTVHRGRSGLLAAAWL